MWPIHVFARTDVKVFTRKNSALDSLHSVPYSGYCKLAALCTDRTVHVRMLTFNTGVRGRRVVPAGTNVLCPGFLNPRIVSIRFVRQAKMRAKTVSNSSP